MKTKILILVFISFTNLLHSQGFTPPAKSKAVVYFVRFSSEGVTTSFEYFHNDKYIGIFKGKNYLRYECDPGKQLFWASSENKEFIEADLKEGGTYIVVIGIVTGGVKYRVKPRPITANDKEDFSSAKKIIMTRPPVIITNEKIAEMNFRLQDFIKLKLSEYNNIWKASRGYMVITPDMDIPAEAMN